MDVRSISKTGPKVKISLQNLSILTLISCPIVLKNSKCRVPMESALNKTILMHKSKPKSNSSLSNNKNYYIMNIKNVNAITTIIVKHKNIELS